MKIKCRDKNQGFTLIEILIAVGISSAVMAMILFMIMSSLDLRNKAARLTTAIFLAEKFMDEIKNNQELVDKSGEVESNPGYSFAYSMNEIEYDPLSGLSTAIKDKEQQLLEQQRAAQSTEISTGLTFKMRKYVVAILYREKKIYELECLRGLKIEQAAK